MLQRLVFIPFLALLLPAASSAGTAVDSGMVQVRVDRDGVVLRVDGVPTPFDSYGDRLERQNGFLLRLPTGIHSLHFSGEGLAEQIHSIAVYRREVTSLDVTLEEAEHRDEGGDAVEASGASGDTVAPPDPNGAIDSAASILVLSDPPAGSIALEEETRPFTAPSVFHLPPGNHSFALSLDGYEPLEKTIPLASGDRLEATFLLRREPPAPQTETEMGLEYESEIPTRNIEEADILFDRYEGLAETFLIIPLFQGILARTLMGGGVRHEANALIGTGVALTAGSYYIGRFISSRRRNEILEENAAIEEQNLRVKETNLIISRQVREKNAEALAEWKAENSDRGVVLLTPR